MLWFADIICQKLGSDQDLLDSNCINSTDGFPKIIFEKVDFEKKNIYRRQKHKSLANYI